MMMLRPVWAAAEPVPVEIFGAGAAGLNADVIPWQNALYGAAGSVDVGYQTSGDRDGRAALLNGKVDFAISADPFSSDELRSRPANSTPLISVPVSVASISVFFGIRADMYQIRTFLPAGCELDAGAEQCDPTDTPYVGNLNLPPQNLAALIAGWGGRTFFSADPWKAAIDVPTLRLSNPDSPNLAAFVYQLEGTSVNQYLLNYIQKISPDDWALALSKAGSGRNWTGAGERYPISAGATVVPRGGYTTGVLAAFTRAGFPNSDGDTGGSWGANAAAVNTDSVKKATKDYAASGMKFVTASVRNALGQYVLPTPQAVQAALVAGGDQPNYAATNEVDGAYPMVYVNRLYAPSSGLSIEQTNAIAALIRYVVTDGQQTVVDNGGVSLTQAMKIEALQQADALVASNCTGTDERIVSGGPGPNEPATPGVVAIGTMKHCSMVPTPEPTTIADSTLAETPTVPETITETTAMPTTVPTTVTDSTKTPVDESTVQATSTAAARATTAVRATRTTTKTTTATTTTTTTTTTATTEGTIESEPVAAVTLPADVVPVGTEVPIEARPSTEAVVTGPPSTRVATYSTTLPMGSPSDGSGFKKLGTFVLGALGFLLGRSFYLRRFAGS